ncbi:PSD1 and planctomycete cytochrome C domain-containing protein [Prosthecobacter sp.]|uniref:PSD1 and planctomycete cytochrome C domain-containing protein n=1 Tax=Prosthecobacter sp. TaxID=1965333 RepID=UPI003784611C
MKLATAAIALSAAFPLHAAELSFERDVRPILKAHCFQCHGEEGEVKGDLDVRLKRFLEKGGESGPAIVAGKPHESLLIDLLKKGKMPKGDKKLKPEEVSKIEQWIATGAKTLRPEPEKIEGHFITEEERQWWAFRPIQNPKVPSSSSTPSHESAATTLNSSPLDAFIRQKLAASKLTPSKEADPATLIRRVYFDLIGLPPTAAEVTAFIQESRDSTTAYERLIERLLARPEYGERWGRHWLDVVGYADSEGYDDADAERSSAWRYRDYVIRAFNADMPFDRFITEQLAGDELIGYPKDGELKPDEIDKLTATGFLRMAPDGTASTKDAVAKNAVITETVKIVSSSLLGMTVGCAECHDHRFDPILQKDFYRLRAILEPGLNYAGWYEPKLREVSLRTAADKTKETALSAEIKQIEADYQKKLDAYQEWTLNAELEAITEKDRAYGKAAALKWRKDREKSLTPEEKQFLSDYPFLKVAATEQQLNLFVQRHDEKVKEFEADVAKHKADIAAVNARMPKIGTVRALSEVPKRPLPVTKVFLRGNHESPGAEVGPGDLTVLGDVLPVDIAPKDKTLPTSGRRLAFAKHLTSGHHPLLARVLVNRFWMHHFGRGIVNSAGDFGAQGEKPSHPELLDWLASDFMSNGWSLKHLHRLVLLSSTYRQSSQRRPEAEQLDSANVLLWRMNVRRLEAETIRDATLAVTGRLNPRHFGEPVGVMEDANAQVVIGEKEPAADGREFRRSIYVQQRRSALPYQLAVFDSPQMEPNCEARNISTVAPQSLLLMNSSFVVEQSQAFAKRVIKEAGDDTSKQATHAWTLAFGRAPSSQDHQDAIAYLTAQTKALPAGSDASEKALASLCQALLGSNPFLYIE